MVTLSSLHDVQCLTLITHHTYIARIHLYAKFVEVVKVSFQLVYTLVASCTLYAVTVWETLCVDLYIQFDFVQVKHSKDVEATCSPVSGLYSSAVLPRFH